VSEQAPMVETERGRRKSMIGVVVSNKMDKTAVVAVERRRPHPLYRKIVRSTTRYKAHDPNNTAVLGDVVRIEETRPISKDKRWRIAETLTRGNVAELAPRDIGGTEVALATPEAVPPAPVVAAVVVPASEAPETLVATIETTAVAEAPAAAEVVTEPEAAAAPEAAGSEEAQA
jgi:small subunit ribosomal protein S17